MKSSKNNTCKLCKEHIDKSDAGTSWTTIIVSNQVIPDDSEKGYHIIKGERYTLCSLCSLTTVQRAVMNKMDENLAKELKA